MSRFIGAAIVDEDRADRRTVEGARRLAAFSDGVVAIAITLVVLPLVDLAGSRTASIGVLLHHDGYRLSAAALSFVVIGSFWREHHVSFERADTWTGRLVSESLLWLAAIVFLPVPTALLFTPGHSADAALAVAVYAGTMAVAQFAMRLMDLEIERHCDDSPAPAPSRWLTAVQWASPVLMTVVATVAVAGLGTRALWLLLLLVPLAWVGIALRRRPARPAGEHADPAGAPVPDP